MDFDLWARLSNSSSYRRYQSRSDSYRGEEYKGEEELRPEFLCPFCADEFDIVGLCCHVDDEHAIEAKNGVCPVCAKKVGTDLVGHITGQHGNLLKMQRRRRIGRGGSNSTHTILRRGLREGNLRSLFGGLSYLSSNTEPDLLLSSFINSPPVVDEPSEVQSLSSTGAFSVPRSSGEDLVERHVQQLPLSDEDQEVKARKFMEDYCRRKREDTVEFSSCISAISDSEDPIVGCSAFNSLSQLMRIKLLAFIDSSIEDRNFGTESFEEILTNLFPKKDLDL